MPNHIHGLLGIRLLAVIFSKEMSGRMSRLLLITSNAAVRKIDF